MITLLLLVSAMCAVHGQIVPLIYAAPSAVSHQSRVDIKHSPGFVAGPLIYSPGTTLYASRLLDNKPQETVLTPIFTADTILSPVALSFFHNLPLARALEHPISLDKVQEENAQKESIKINDEDVANAIITEIPDQGNESTEEKQDENYIIIAYDDSNQSKTVKTTTEKPKMDAVTEP